MSSHHIVREKQEPGLLILEPEQFDPEHLGQLLEWSPTVVAADSAAGYCEELGIKVDGVLTTDPGLPVQAHARRILHSGDPLGSGVRFFLDEGYPALNIIRQQADFRQYVPYAERISLVVYSGNKKLFPIRPGFTKWKMRGELIEVSEPAGILSATNLVPVSDHLFRVEDDGFCSFSFSGPFIFVTEEL